MASRPANFTPRPGPRNVRALRVTLPPEEKERALLAFADDLAALAVTRYLRDHERDQAGSNLRKVQHR